MRDLTHPSLLRKAQQHGFTLIEIMIALTIGLILLAAAGYIFSASTRAYRQNDGLARLQENTRGAQLLVNTVIRNAGYLPDPLYQTSPSQYFLKSASVDTRAVFGGYGAPTSAFVPASSPTPVSNSDWVAISYMGCAVNASPTATDCPSAASAAVVGTGASVNRLKNPEVVALRNCLGHPVPDKDLSTAINTQIVVNIFYVAQGPNDLAPALYCATANYDPSSMTQIGAANIQSILPGVNRMDVLYGIDHQLNRQTDQRVVSSALDSGLNGVSWSMVSMVQLNLTTQNSDKIAFGSQIQGQKNISSSGYLQARQSQSVMIRNRLN